MWHSGIVRPGSLPTVWGATLGASSNAQGGDAANRAFNGLEHARARNRMAGNGLKVGEKTKSAVWV